MDDMRKKVAKLIDELSKEQLLQAAQLLQALLDRDKEQEELLQENSHYDLDLRGFKFISAAELSLNLGIEFDEENV